MPNRCSMPKGTFCAYRMLHAQEIKDAREGFGALKRNRCLGDAL